MERLKKAPIQETLVSGFSATQECFKKDAGYRILITN